MSNPIMPDALELQGTEMAPNYHVPTVPVVVEGPVRTEQLPSRLGDARTFKVIPARSVLTHTSGDVTFHGKKDSRRRKILLLSTDQPFYYGMDQEMVESGNAAIWPINVPLPIEHTDEFFLASANVAGSTISIIREDWSL